MIDGATRNNHVHVNDSKFIENESFYGGGVFSGYVTYNRDIPIKGSFYFELCLFIKNSARYGGGNSMQSYRNTINSTVLFYNCSWTKNSALFGSAMSILPNTLELYTEGSLPSPVLDDCTFDSNVIRRTEMYFESSSFSQYSQGVGTIYCSLHSIYVQGEVSFTDNKYTALYLTSCQLIASQDSTTIFSDNTGLAGGAIYLLGNAFINVSANTTFKFNNNSALYQGGALYYYPTDRHNYDFSFSCFIQFIETKPVSERNINFIFSGNNAGIGNQLSSFGHSIYASSLAPCRRQFSEQNKCQKVDIFECIGNFDYSGSNRSFEIATSESTFAINGTSIDHNIMSLPFIPGKLQRLPFVTLDEFDEVNSAVLQISILAANHSVTTNSFYISSNEITLFGNPGDNATISLTTTNSHVFTLSFDAVMQPCPPGFILNMKSNSSLLSCICSIYTPKMYYGIQKCILLDFTAYRSRGYWVGYSKSPGEDEKNLISGYCPLGFCISQKNRTLLPQIASTDLLNTEVCTVLREGILCGRCSANHSVKYHSMTYKCGPNEKCHYEWIFYVLSEIIPVTLFFMFVIFFGISFTSGSAYGFIFFTQVAESLQISGGDLIFLPRGVTIMNKFHQTLYFSLNLRFFEFENLSFCIFKNASALDMIAFRYVTLTYAFLLVLVLIIVIKSQKFWILLHRLFKIRVHTTKGTIIHGISTFLVVCYSQCAQMSLLLLSSARLWGQGGSIHSTVSKYNGELELFSLPHLKYAIPAIVFLIVIVIIPPLLLLAYPLCYKIFSCLSTSESRGIVILCKIIPLEKFKPFFDSFQSCFKDEYRFFSGLYFIYRFVLLMSMALFHYRNFYLVAEIQLVLILIIHSICQPYKERSHNLVDILLFGNLILINGITMFNFSSIESAFNAEYTIQITGWIQAVLIFIPILCGLVYMILSRPTILRAIKNVLRCRKTAHKSVGRSSSGYFDDVIPSRSCEYPSPYQHFQ